MPVSNAVDFKLGHYPLIALVLLLALLTPPTSAQDSASAIQLTTTTASTLVPPLPQQPRWRILPPPPPRRPSFVRRHPALVGSLIGASLGTVLYFVGRQRCNHYEYGQSGVNVPCPREDHDGR